MSKHVIVTGGVSSSLGKGITASSLGALLAERGLSVTIQKLDPYLNVDPGTLNPYEHGEVFVTDDGSETDLDLGHYERFTGATLTNGSNATTGQIYQTVLAAERRGEYLGKTVQVIPHVTNEIKRRIRDLDNDDVDVVITEIGGTVGDIEILPYLEAARQLKLDVGRGNVCYIHVTLVPYLAAAGEQKTKPTQHSVVELRSRGIQPDVIVCRSASPVPENLRAKIGNLCDLAASAVIDASDMGNIYEVPLWMHEGGLDQEVCEVLRLLPEQAQLPTRRAEDPTETTMASPQPDLSKWENIVRLASNTTETLNIGLVGKYVELPDAYLSVVESLYHAGWHQSADVNVEWISSDELSGLLTVDRLNGLDGLVIPGGFGERGVEGKVAAVKWSRENNVPTLGLCLGMQVMVIEYGRHVLGLSGANSTEFDETTDHPVIYLMLSQHGIEDKGGTMRLGAQIAELAEGSRVAELYGKQIVSERHRHRYEFNPKYRSQFENSDLWLCGHSPDGKLVEFVELKDHPFWVGTQAHPEFKSRPWQPAPLFAGLIAAALNRKHS